jgi:hypothetical protein
MDSHVRIAFPCPFPFLLNTRAQLGPKRLGLDQGRNFLLRNATAENMRTHFSRDFCCRILQHGNPRHTRWWMSA